MSTTRNWKQRLWEKTSAHRHLIGQLDFKAPHVWLATWFGSGFIYPAPGTWGTLATIPLGVACMALGGLTTLAFAIVIVSLAGIWAIRRFETTTRTHDNAIVVIDEAAGMLITLLAAPFTPAGLVCAFILFRIFDILKPWPVGWLDKNIKGAYGVMADDWMAGVYAALVLAGGRYAGLF